MTLDRCDGIWIGVSNEDYFCTGSSNKPAISKLRK